MKKFITLYSIPLILLLSVYVISSIVWILEVPHVSDKTINSLYLISNTKELGILYAGRLSLVYIVIGIISYVFSKIKKNGRICIFAKQLLLAGLLGLLVLIIAFFSFSFYYSYTGIYDHLGPNSYGCDQPPYGFPCPSDHNVFNH